MATGGDWRRVVCGLLGAPATATNLTGLALWAQSEGMPPTANNWLATSLRITGSWGPPAPYSEPFYYSLNQGAMATAQTIYGGYPGVVRALQTGHDLPSLFANVNDSTWCRGCETGHYPIALWQYIGGHSTPPAAPTIPPPTTPWRSDPGQTALMAQWWAELASWVEVGTLLLWQELYNAQAIAGSI